MVPILIFNPRQQPSETLQSLADILAAFVAEHPALSGGLSREDSSTAFWGCFSSIISSAVQQIDQTGNTLKHEECFLYNRTLL
jgi:hypothetical protein